LLDSKNAPKRDAVQKRFSYKFKKMPVDSRAEGLPFSKAVFRLLILSEKILHQSSTLAFQ